MVKIEACQSSKSILNCPNRVCVIYDALKSLYHLIAFCFVQGDRIVGPIRGLVLDVRHMVEHQSHKYSI